MTFKGKLFCILIFFCLIPRGVYAISFWSTTPGEAPIMTVHGIENQDSRKYTKDYLGTTFYDAYCGDQGTHFTTSQNFAEVSKYKNEKHCSYTLNGVNNNAYCDKMVARVIQVAREQDNNLEIGWRWAQMCVWAYLGHHADDNFKLRNNYAYGDVLSGTYVYYNNFSSVIAEAARRYSASNVDYQQSSEENVSNKINLNVSDNNLYFVPNGNSCSGGGYYITKTFTLKNDLEVKKSFNITVNVNSETTSNPIYICNADRPVEQCSQISQRIELKAGEQKKYYLKSASSITWPNGINLKVALVPYTEERVTEGSIPDTAYFSNSGNQNMIVYVPNSGSNSSNVTVKGSQERQFNYLSLTHKTCNDFPNNKTDNENTYTPSSGVVSKSCASKFIDSSGNLPTKDKYEANFANCDCKLIEFDGGKVNIRIYENVLFRYGVLNPISVYPGGGFRFARKNESITTDYISSLTWRYVDYKDNKPYYYNTSNMSDSIVNADIHKKIDEKVKSLIKDSLDLKFETIDSNDAKVGKKTITISSGLTVTETKNNIDGYNYTTYLSKTSDNGISMNDAYFGNDGTVSYDSNSGYLHFGGKNYYIPVNYRDSSFPFKIPEINLSVIKDNFYKFLYEADCSIKVINDPDNPDPDPDPSDEPDYFEKAVVYRSIDLNNPFPRANQSTGEGIKENWKDWYAGSNSNKQRLKRAFDNYPTAPLYAVEMDSDKLKRIFDNNRGRSYNDWNSISDGGVNSFIMEYGVDYSRSGNSFCYIGQFNSECDRW